MPGVLNSNSDFGFSREVGKMAHSLYPPLNMEFDDGQFNDMATEVLGLDKTTLDFIDSDCELPDSEHPMDLVRYMNDEVDILSFGFDLSARSEIEETYNKYSVFSNQDPFMGMSSQINSPTCKNSLLSQMMNSLDYDDQFHDHFQQQQKQEVQGFEAWGHRSLKIKEEKDDYIDDIEELTKSSFSHLASSIYQDEEVDNLPVSFLDTPSPSSQSGTATGDDSDVDIETVTESPRGAHARDYFTQGSTSSSRAGSPTLFSSGLLSILTKSPAEGPLSPPSSSSACSSASSSPRPNPTVHFNTYGVSSSASLAENLMKGRTSLLGHKRKAPKEKRSHHHHHHHHNHHQLEQRISSSSQQHAYSHVLCTSNSLNFHDYAMSPLSPESSPSYIPSTSNSTETGVPTVPQTKRVYKRKHLPLDATDKEKQHHHNQLERNRRQKLADLFVDLRDEVPKISLQSKASKVMILNEATMYIHELQRLEESQEKDISIELKRKEALSRQLRHLKSQLGGGRIG
ncbi:Myc proto-oncogene protein [Elysia marginata]|uniref:Myc proto-oncogene protein n=1 Tax=Elysia marginata TaxID=1093978 RepID=A0AAV4JLH7_9GAST|nr:Myc proto-oncogene protein [Elysia marginata]